MLVFRMAALESGSNQPLGMGVPTHGFTYETSVDMRAVCSPHAVAHGIVRAVQRIYPYGSEGCNCSFRIAIPGMFRQRWNVRSDAQEIP